MTSYKLQSSLTFAPPRTVLCFSIAFIVSFCRDDDVMGTGCGILGHHTLAASFERNKRARETVLAWRIVVKLQEFMVPNATHSSSSEMACLLEWAHSGVRTFEKAPIQCSA